MSDPAPRPRRIQIFGERCSGTNWVAQILRRNLPGMRLVDDFGWKHSWATGAPEQGEDCIFVVVHRDPFDWLRSLHQMPWHTGPELRGVPFAQFLRTPWRCVWGSDMELAVDDARHGTEMLHERDPATGEPFANAMRLRTAKIRSWDALRDRVRHHVVLRYETVLADPRAFVREFAARFGLRRWPWFRGVKTFKGGPQRFQQKRYEPIACDDLQWIAQELDSQLELTHGFDLYRRVAELRVPDSGAADAKR
jgi:hypothetical protein